MTGSIPPANPLSYEGQVVVPFINRTFSPTTAFNKFPVPTVWINTEAMEAYMLVAKPLGVADWISLGGASGALNTITTPDSTVVTPTAGNINFLNGMGMDITGSGSNITFNTTGAGFSWNFISGLTQALSVNNGYIASNAAGVAFTLPATANVGDAIWVSTVHAGGFTIAQNAGQQIQLGDVTTTSGAGGSLASTKIGDSVLLLCTTANTNFLALCYVGDITYV